MPLVLRGLFHRVLTVNTPFGRKFRPVFLSQGGPRIRTRRADLDGAGITRVPRMSGTKGGMPLLDNGNVPHVANVIWCTGFHSGLSWVHLPVFDADGRPRHENGIVSGEAGLYFVGLKFLHSVTSTMIHGVGRDAERIADTIRARVTGRTEAAS
jgi:putative flavoprotein involved in K+ transport